MKRSNDIHFEELTPLYIEAAAERAFKGHSRKREVKAFRKDFDANCVLLYDKLKDESYTKLIGYTPMEKDNINGKHRHIDSPALLLRIYQHLALELLEGYYASKDNRVGLNCKKGYGITSKKKEGSVLHRMKQLYYNRRDLHYIVTLDQRKCYEHVTEKVFRNELKNLTTDRWLIDFACKVSFVGRKLPIGTPTSPFVHHVLMLRFDHWCRRNAPFAMRYADDAALAFATKEEAQQMKWRVKQWWWYELGMRAKRHTIKVQPIDGLPLDYCGYVLHRNDGKGVSVHNKGYVTVRRSTTDRAKRSTNKNWGSYFGIMKHADAFGMMRNIEYTMKLKQLTDKVRIIRELDAPNITMKDLEGVTFTIKDYDIRYKDGKPDWVKCLIGIRDKDTGRIVAREFHGGYFYLADWLHKVEIGMGGKQNILPIEDCEVEHQCGYIFKGSNEPIMEFIE